MERRFGICTISSIVIDHIHQIIDNLFTFICLSISNYGRGSSRQAMFRQIEYADHLLTFVLLGQQSGTCWISSWRWAFKHLQAPYWVPYYVFSSSRGPYCGPLLSSGCLRHRLVRSSTNFLSGDGKVRKLEAYSLSVHLVYCFDFWVSVFLPVKEVSPISLCGECAPNVYRRKLHCLWPWNLDLALLSTLPLQGAW